MGIGFLSNNVMLPILDFFYGLVPSYGLAIVALTLVIRLALYPLSAGSIRNARRMKIANPVLQKRQQEIKERFKDDPSKQQEELAKLFQEFGNPLSGCLPLVVQMPILFALFATLRGSPFADTAYTFNFQILPQDKIEQVQLKAVTTKPQNLYVTDGVHFQITGILPSGNRLAVGDQGKALFQMGSGKPLRELAAEYPGAQLKPKWTVVKGADRISIDENGVFQALEPGDVSLQAKIPGLASNRGFLFIKALGQVGVVAPDGTINWDILSMVLMFAVSLFLSQSLSGQGGGTGNPQQDMVNKLTPVLISGMFLFFPLPAGVLMYMVIANIFQTAQAFILSKEPLPENLQKIVDAEKKKEVQEERLPFEPTGSKKVKDKPEVPVTEDGALSLDSFALKKLGEKEEPSVAPEETLGFQSTVQKSTSRKSKKRKRTSP
jgi:YidC/Oxa1 family membrane protein insertase